MSKRNVAYIKPNEPSFLRRIKEQAGYKEGPTLDTKREDLGPIEDEDLLDTEEEQPTVVVLKSGDLTAEEAAEISNKLKKDEEEAPADLSKPIVFKSRAKDKPSSAEESSGSKTSTTKRSSTSSKDEAKKSKKSKGSKALLSFNDEEEEEDADF